MKNLILIVVVVLLAACGKESNQNKLTNQPPNTPIAEQYLSSEGSAPCPTSACVHIVTYSWLNSQGGAFAFCGYQGFVHAKRGTTEACPSDWTVLP